jgi:hypothetical protein
MRNPDNEMRLRYAMKTPRSEAQRAKPHLFHTRFQYCIDIIRPRLQYNGTIQVRTGFATHFIDVMFGLLDTPGSVFWKPSR